MLTRSLLWPVLSTGLFLFVLGPSPTHAGSRDFAVYATRLGGDTETAQPYIDRFAAYVAKATGWPKESLKGSFLPSKKETLGYIESHKPGFAVLEPWLYFERRKADKLEPIAEVDSTDLNSPRLHVVVKEPTIKSLGDLKGKRLWTLLAESPRYLGQVVLDGKQAPESFFQLKQVGTPMKAVRAVLRGEADAALVDDEQLEAAKKMEGGAALRTIYTSPPLPPVVAVVFAGTAAPADKKAIEKVLLEMCNNPEGKMICQEMHIGKFEPLNKTLFKEAERRYEATQGATK